MIFAKMIFRRHRVAPGDTPGISSSRKRRIFVGCRRTSRRCRRAETGAGPCPDLGPTEGGLRHDERSRSILPSSLRRTVQNTRNAQVSRTAGSRSGRGSTASWSGPTAPGLGSRATCAPASQEQRALCVPPLACVHRSCWRARTSTCPGEASEWMAYRAVPGAGSASPAVAKGCSCRWRRRDRRLGHAAAVAS